MSSESGDLRGVPGAARELEEVLGQAARALQRGQSAEAEALYRRVAADVWAGEDVKARAVHGLAVAIHRQGRLAEAVAQYRQVLRIRPYASEANNNLANALASLGHLDAAVASYRTAVETNPRYAEAHFNLGNALAMQGQLEEAAEAYRLALRIEPELVAAAFNLANMLAKEGKLADAIEFYRGAIDRKPDYVEAHINLGNALLRAARLDEAVEAYHRALSLRPANAIACYNLGTALQRKGALAEAVAAYERALTLSPGFPEALNARGIALAQQERLPAAIESYGRAVALRGDFAEAHCNLGQILARVGRDAEAVAALARAVALKPDLADALAALIYQKLRICDWSNLDDACVRLRTLARDGSASVPPFSLVAIGAPNGEQAACCRRWATRFAVSAPRRALRLHSKIRIGYIGNEFHDHATARLMVEMLELHDRDRFAVSAYSYGPDDGSVMCRRVRAAFDTLTDIQTLNYADAARRVADDEVDILVDLKGYTPDARTQILAHRPAAIQVNYLGFPGTMGADFIDYVIADAVIAPPDFQNFCSERIVRLPHCFQPNDSTRAIAARPTRASCDLGEEDFVFCCFNNSYKISPAVFDIWMRLLAAVPGSVLWLLESNELVRAHLRMQASARGIEPLRLVFAKWLPAAQHLARQRVADLFLDTTPVNALTTASDALWAGLPVLTCVADAPAGRGGSSLLRAVDLPELIAVSLDEYEAIAINLAREPARLAALRNKLQRNLSTTPLFDTRRYTRNLEVAFNHMLETYQRGDAPTSFDVSAISSTP